VDPLNFPEFVDGWFTITGANGDGLSGYYSGFVLNLATGDYDLEWAFTGGTGRFLDYTGTGHTDGLANLVTGEAEFEFSGTISNDGTCPLCGGAVCIPPCPNAGT
jgi:hypothetical protein